MSSNSPIGGNLETSIIMDVTGVRIASQTAAQHLDTLENAVERTSAAFVSSTADTAAAAAAIERAANMVELLSMRMLALQTNSEKASAAMRRTAADAGTIGTSGRSLTDMMMGGSLAHARAQETQAENDRILELQRQFNEDMVRLLQTERQMEESERAAMLAALRADIQARTAVQQQWIADQARLLAVERQTDESERAAMLAALRKDIEDRSRLMQTDQQNRRRWAQARDRNVFQDAQRFNAGANQNREDPWRMDASNLSEGFFRRARELREWERGRVAAEGMRNAIQQMRANLDPMVAMQQHLALQAAEFAENMERAVRTGHLNNEQAEELLLTYRQLTDQQLEQARMQQMSFLGMRNFGFAAQQGAYAVEDFMQVFSTMGAAGGIRAAANNLTAMAAVMGPTVGVVASLASAAAMLAVHAWESHDASKKTKEVEEQRLKIIEAMVNAFERQMHAERTLAEIRQASLSSFGSVLSDLQSQSDDLVIKAREEAAKAAFERVDKITAEIEALRMRGQNIVMGAQFAGPGAAPGPIAIREMARVEAQRALMKDREKELTEELEQQQRLAEEMSSTAFQLQQHENTRLAILTRTSQLLEDAPKNQERMVDLQLQYAAVLQQQFFSEEGENERVRMAINLAERMLELREEGAAAAENVRASITEQFEGLNEVFRRENQILETRKRMNEQIDKAVQANRVNAEQAEAAREEMERVIALEQERFDAQKRLEELNERAQQLSTQLQQNQSPTTLAGVVTRGSAQDLQILEQDRFNRLRDKQNEPVVKELQRILAEIKAQKAELQRIANEVPNVAALEGF